MLINIYIINKIRKKYNVTFQSTSVYMYIKCCYAESGWLSTHILPVEHTGNLISADLSKVLHQTQYMYSFLDDILCMCLYTQIWHRIMYNSL